MADVVLDPKVIERLDKIDWEGLKKSTGITREQIEKNPAVASQLAYQQYTDLIFGSTNEISGQFSLRAVPGKGEDDSWKVKAYTIENEKKPGDKLFLYGSPITSKAALDALFERTSWENNQGKKVFGRANANAGRPIAIEREVDGQKKKDYYLVSIHEPTNRVVGIPVDAVKRMLQNPDGTSRGTSVYGAKLSDQQVDAICRGEHVVVSGCRNKDGKEFTTAVQFDVAKRQIVPSHPTFLKQAQRAGVDILGNRKEGQAQEAKVEVKQDNKAVKGRKATPKKDEKKGGKLSI